MSFKTFSYRSKRRRIVAEISKCIAEIGSEDAEILDCESVALSQDIHAAAVDTDCAVDHCLIAETLCNETDCIATSSNQLDGLGYDIDDFCGDDEPLSISATGSSTVETWEDNQEWQCRSVSDCDDDPSDEGCDDIFEDLSNWAVVDNISQASVSRLLTILRKKLPELPADARTLLHTQRNVVTQHVTGGEYFFFGIRYWLDIMLRNSGGKASLSCRHLHLHVNIDSIPLFNSTNVSLWPILGLFTEWKKSLFFRLHFTAANLNLVQWMISCMTSFQK